MKKWVGDHIIRNEPTWKAALPLKPPPPGVASQLGAVHVKIKTAVETAAGISSKSISWDWSQWTLASSFPQHFKTKKHCPLDDNIFKQHHEVQLPTRAHTLQCSAGFYAELLQVVCKSLWLQRSHRANRFFKYFAVQTSVWKLASAHPVLLV